MKISTKIKAILLSMLCIAALTSCGNKTENVPAVASVETSGTEASGTAAEEKFSGETASVVSETTTPTETSEKETTLLFTEADPVTTEETSAYAEPPAEYPHLTPLTDEARFRLCDDYAKLWGQYVAETTYDMRIVYYYGTYDSGEVVVMNDLDVEASDDEQHFSVGGYDFYLPGGSYWMALHKDSAFFTIKYAYESGYLSDSDIEEIHYHAENSDITQPNLKLKEPELVPLTDEAEQKLREDFAKLVSDHYSRLSLTADDISIVYYFGTYDSGEAAVLFPFHHFVTTDDMKHYDIAGYFFDLSSGSYRLMIHTGSEFIEIDKAYEMGILNDNDLMEIHYHNTQAYPIKNYIVWDNASFNASQ